MNDDIGIELCEERSGEALCAVERRFGKAGLRAVATFMQAMGADAYLVWDDENEPVPCDFVMQEAWGRGGAPQPDPAMDRIEAVAAAIWETYVASPIVQDGSRDLTWADLCRMAERHGPDSAPGLYKATALAEARAAIAAMDARDAG